MASMRAVEQVSRQRLQPQALAKRKQPLVAPDDGCVISKH